MNLSIQKYLLPAMLLMATLTSKASHIIGGDVSYTYDGDETVAGTIYHKYTVRLSIYEDCLNGQPGAIAQDNPAFLAVYDGTGSIIEFDSITYSSSVIVPPVFNASPCGTVPSSVHTCLLKKTFVKTYLLLPNSTGYIVAYQRCCRNNAIVNIAAPGDHGATFSCNIPASPLVNNSAVFTNNPHQIICLGLPLYYDNSATDPDGDSLSYAFCDALDGASDANIKPIPNAPPYDPTTYVAPYSARSPFSGSGSVSIDPVTGIITGTPDDLGRHLVTVGCYEWRGGVIIDSVTREFQFIVTNCDAMENGIYGGPDTAILVGDTVFFHDGGLHGSRWTPGTYLSDTTGNAIGHFTTAGVFTYTLHGITDSGCSVADTRRIHVLEHTMFAVPSAFTPNGDGRNEYLLPMPIYNATLINFRVFNRMGNLVYSGGPGSAGWDGTYKGKQQDLGVYVWELRYKDNNGAERIQTGNVTLVR